MDSKSDNIEIMIGDSTIQIINELFSLFLRRYQICLEESMKGSDFVFDHVNGLHYKSNIISLNHSESYIDSPKQMKNQKVTRNPKFVMTNVFSMQ